MPALLPVAGVVRVACRGTAAGVAIVNVFHVQAGTGSLSTTDVTAVATGVKTAYETNFVPRLAGGYSGDTVTAVDLSTIFGVGVQLPLAGSSGAPAITTPNSMACCVTWRINRHYRGGHPRTYLGPIGSGSVESPTTFTPTFVTTITNSATAFLTAVQNITVAAFDVNLVSVHRYRNKALLTVPEVSIITAASVDTRIDSMRRRLGRDR